MKCKFYVEDKCECEITGLIPSHPQLYCKNNPEECPIYKDVVNLGLEKAKIKAIQTYNIYRRRMESYDF